MPRIVLAAALAATASAQFVEPTRLLFTATGAAAGDQFGWVSSPLTDVDADGVDDVLVGAPGHDAGGSSAGRVYLLSGRTGRQLWHADGPAPLLRLGHAVRDAGDHDGDGTHDALIGAPGSGSGQFGRVFVLSGRDGTVLQTFLSATANDRFGGNLAGLASIDGDPTPDYAIGAFDDDLAGTNAGRVDVVSGRNGALLLRRTGQRPGARLGSALGNAGDLDGDRREELLIGARDDGPANGGLVFVHDLATNQTRFTLTPDPGAAAFGDFFVAAIGDANGDRISDLYVGDYADSSSGAFAGKAYLFSGADGQRLRSWSGAAGDGFGIGRGLGDLDGDGAADLLLCGYTNGAGAPTAGRAQVFSGRTGTLLRTITSRSGGEGFGFDAHGLGDVDRDGVPDLFITAATNGAGGPAAGRCYLIAGCAAEVVEVGTAVAGTAGIAPRLQLPGCPGVGRSFTIDLDRTSPGAIGALLLGTVLLPVPASLGSLVPTPDDVWLHQAPRSGAQTFPFLVPSATVLTGLAIGAKAVYLDGGAANGLSWTTTLQLTIR